MVSKDYIISPLDTGHPELFFELIDTNRERLEDFFAGTVKQTRTLDDTRMYCKAIEVRRTEKSYFPFIIKDNNGEWIGLIDFKNIEWGIPKAEIGYFIDAEWEGRGVISSALQEVIVQMVLAHKFKKLLCRSSSKNIGSIRVALKNQFELEGCIRLDYKTTKGELVDLNYYGRIFD